MLSGVGTVPPSTESHDQHPAISLVEREGGDIPDDVIDSMVAEVASSGEEEGEEEGEEGQIAEEEKGMMSYLCHCKCYIIIAKEQEATPVGFLSLSLSLSLSLPLIQKQGQVEGKRWKKEN